MYITTIYKGIFCKGTSHWWFIGKIDNFIWKYSWYISDELFFFLLSDINIWYFFVIYCNCNSSSFSCSNVFNCFNSLWWMRKWYLSFVPSSNVMRWAIWYHLYNSKNVKLPLLHGRFSRFLNCTNGTKLRNASQIETLH